MLAQLAGNMTMETHRCEKCDQSFTDSDLFACHPCSERLTATSNQKDLGKYKCSQCSEFFFKPGSLKHHFISIHSGCAPEGPFLCTQSGCQVSSTNQQDYHVHLRTAHGLNLIPCTVQSCSASFLTQDEMERHKQVHMPFGCFHCQFVTQNVKDLSDHVLKHCHLPDCKGDETATTCLRTNIINEPQVSGNPNRKPISSPSQASSLPEDGIEEPLKRQKHKKRHRTAADTAPLPSKEYLAEGSEHIYRTHTCPKCRRCFKMRSHLQEHLHLHFPDPTLQCPTCKRYFSSKSKLGIHRLRESGEKVHRCHLCEYSAMERNAIRRHLVTVHAEEAQDDLNRHSYPCPTCGQRFHQSRLLKAHMKTHNIPSESKQQTCFQQDCTFQSSSNKDLLQHAAKVHGVKALECRRRACGAIFQSQAEMESHYRTHLAYHCSQCDYSCSNKAVFLQHQRHGHPGNDRLCCDFCSFVTFNPVEFEQHIGHLHANEKIYHCSHCSYATSHKRSLTRHMLLHSGEKPHKCSVCDYRCRDVSYLSKHMLTHSEDKNFMCAQCGYVTKWKHSLNVHMRKHAGDLRYHCDQCTYRSHRMDQLNSHKLRHQAKTLICEICAFACKRKYELRNHMLAKHSGEGKQISLLKCTYCTYTTCYRQALQNHENCKHTKLKEFRCALCSYSSFSSISLFLHKRKVHGYVPGDKEWLENYAAREKERNSAEFMMDFYKNSPITPEQFKHSSSEGPLPSLQEQKETGTGSQNDSVDVLDVVSQEVVSDSISDGPTAVEGPEEYCTLVLTTLSNSTDPTPSLQNEQDNCTNPIPSSPTLKYNGSDISLEKTDLSPSSAEEDSAVMADAECPQRELSDNYVDLTNRSPPGESGICKTHRDGTDGRRASSTLERNQPLETELCLKKKNNNNKEHAEAMFLDGRVQMLVVPNKDIYHCDTCSYVTRNKTALKYHCQALCHGRIKEHKCQACGALFKQKRGLDTHHKKKCPALCRKTSSAVGIPKPRDSTVGHNVFTQLHKIRQTGLPYSLNGTCTDSDDQELNHHRAEVFSSHLTDCKEKLLDHTAKEKLFSHNKTVPLRSLYTKKDGKFKCKLCNFSAVRISTVERHLSVCRKRENLIVSEADDDCGNESIQSKENIKEECCKKNSKTSGKRQIFSCPSCAFKCDRKRALDCHERTGCLKPDEVQCTLCSFVAKSKMSLTRHILYVHKKEHHKKKFVVAKQKRLHCQHCNFTCKQGRCMVLHVAHKHKGVRPHRCQYCPFSTTRHYRLQQHESLHTGIGRHSCSICEKTFGTVTKLRQHKIRIHDKQPTHFCSLCDFSGYALDDVRRHNQRCHSGALQHSCSHCVAQFNSEVALRNHCKRVHQLQAWLSCNQCDYTCSSDVTLKSHQEIKHPQVKCNTCQEAFKTKESLMVHQRSHLAHQCQLCPFATRTRQLLAQHLLGVHEEGSSEDKPLKCSTCEFVCRHQLVLEQHLRSHGGKRLYKCTDCEYSTRNKQKIAWHIRIHTGEKPYSCELCSYTCTDPSRLKLHMRVHQEEKKYLCPQCGYKCKWATQLKYHLTKHTGDKPYACEECSYRTNRADALRAHRDTQHCDTRPYVCEKCGKAFKTSFILKTHQHQHSNDRPYVCGVCHKAFRWPAGLRHHYLSHTKQQPFCCCHCSYRAKQKFQVVKHLQRHHPGMSTEEGVVRDSKAGSLTLKDALQGTLDESAVEEDDSTANEKEAVAIMERGENSDSKMLHCKTLHKI